MGTDPALLFPIYEDVKSSLVMVFGSLGGTFTKINQQSIIIIIIYLFFVFKKHNAWLSFSSVWFLVIQTDFRTVHFMTSQIPQYLVYTLSVYCSVQYNSLPHLYIVLSCNTFFRDNKLKIIDCVSFWFKIDQIIQ